MLGSSRTPLGASRPKAQQARDELVNSRYNLTEPQAGVYPLDGTTGVAKNDNIKYPDFLPWKHTADEDHVAESHLQKGYFEPPCVSNEFLSARNIMHQLLRSKNSLEELSSNLLKAIDVHSQYNKVGQGSYKPPPRVTLTDQKREAWLRDLAQNSVPLRKLARTIPHGVRNKQLLDQCLSKNVPINRAIWFVRCVSTNELRQLKRKGGANIEFQWVQEWTTQVVDFIEKLSQDYLRFETFQQATDSWKFKVSYILRFASNLYIENLIDKEIFKGWIIKFFKNCKMFELPLALTLTKMFWSEICQTDYLVKELTESLILKYDKVSSCKSLLEAKDVTITDIKLNDEIKRKLLAEFKTLINSSFDQCVDNFILPNNWSQLEPTLRAVLNLDDAKVSKRFEIISYRNESLMINYSLDKQIAFKDIVTTFDSLGDTLDYNNAVAIMLKTDVKSNVQMLLKWALTKYRSDPYRVYTASELLKKLKSQPQVSTKDLEMDVLEFVFVIPSFQSQILMKNVFHLLNELTRCKLFRPSTYMRRLISSGLIYLQNNETEKGVHALILKNLKPQKSSQATMILKNLDNSGTTKANQEEKIKAGLQMLTASEDFFQDPQKLAALEELDTGFKLELSEAYLTSILARDNLFPLMTYKEFQRIIKTVMLLQDFRGLFTVLVKGLESGSLEEAELELACDVVLTYKKLAKALIDWDVLTRLMMENCTRTDSSTCLKKLLQLGDESLSDEVSLLLKSKEFHFDTNKASRAIANLGLSLTVHQLAQESGVHNNFQVLIRSLFTNPDDEKRRSATALLSVLKSINATEFNRVLFVYIKKTYSNASELLKYEPLIDLVISELMSLETLVTMFMSFKAPMYTTVVMDMLFKDMSQSSSHDFFKLDLLREMFKREHKSLMMTLFKECLTESETKLESIQSDSADIINSLLPESRAVTTTYRTEMFGSFLDVLTHEPTLAISTMNSLGQDGKDSVISWLHRTVCEVGDATQGEPMKIDYQTELSKYATRLDRFNLPIVQLLLKLILGGEVSTEILSSFLESSLTSFKGDENVFGAMFELLDSDLKARCLHYFESVFLNSPTFPYVTMNGVQVNLGVISTTLITLSRGSKNVDLPDELVFALDVSLESLIRLVGQSENAADEVYTAISLLLKILIIHKSFLIHIVIERNAIKENFLNNLVNLLTTKLVSQNLQLKNLLYDLILSIKSSVNEMNSSQTSVVKLPVSITSLPAISPVDKVSTHKSHNKQNLHDFSTTGDLYLHNKNTYTFHELNIKPFDMVEDSNAMENLNDTAISLQLFEASIERKNPT